MIKQIMPRNARFSVSQDCNAVLRFMWWLSLKQNYNFIILSVDQIIWQEINQIILQRYAFMVDYYYSKYLYYVSVTIKKSQH